MRAVDALETLELLGADQWGLVTTAQAQAAGLSKVRLSRLADQGTLSRVRHGVYALPSAGTDPLQDLRAAWLATDPSRSPYERVNGPQLVVVSGQSAAAVHRLGDILPPRHEFTAQKRRQTNQPDVRFHRAAVTGDDVNIVDGLPVTSVARTVADLVRGGVDADHLSGVLGDALRRRGVTTRALAAALETRAAHYGYPSGVAALEALAPPVPSYLSELTKNLTSHLDMKVPQSTLDAIAQLVTQYLDSSMANAAANTAVTKLIKASMPELKIPDVDRALSDLSKAVAERDSLGKHPTRTSEAQSIISGEAEG